MLWLTLFTPLRAPSDLFGEWYASWVGTTQKKVEWYFAIE